MCVCLFVCLFVCDVCMCVVIFVCEQNLIHTQTTTWVREANTKFKGPKTPLFFYFIFFLFSLKENTPTFQRSMFM